METNRGNRIQETYHIDRVRVERVTEKALLYICDRGVQHWIPFSQIVARESEIKRGCSVGDRGLLVVTYWFAKNAKLFK